MVKNTNNQNGDHEEENLSHFKDGDVARRRIAITSNVSGHCLLKVIGAVTFVTNTNVYLKHKLRRKATTMKTKD